MKTYELYLKDSRGIEHTYIRFNYGGFIEAIEVYSEAISDWVQVLEPLHLPENTKQIVAWESLKALCQSEVDSWLYDNQYNLQLDKARISLAGAFCRRHGI